MRRTLFVPVIILILALVLSGCGSSMMLGAAPAADTLANVVPATPVVNQQVNPGVVPVDSNSALAAIQGTFEQIYAHVNPSVVNIQVAAGQINPLTGMPGGGLGSGFVWYTQGHIITNNHVVESASQISVIFADGNTVEAELVGADPNSDLAVIQVDLPASYLKPVTMADPAQVKVGQLAIAIGNPYGLSGTMTEGIISAMSRSLPVSAETSPTGGSYTIPDIIQTDAAINPGNSGGVLVNVQGQVVGVTAAIRSETGSNTGIGFVIPANIVNRVVPVLIESGSYEHPRLGVSGTTLTADLAEAMDLPTSQRGVVVMEVVPGGPADRAGLQGGSTQNTASGLAIPTGDVITAIDGQAVSRFEDLTSYLFNHTQVRQTVTLTILRQGQEQTVQLTLGSLSLQQDQ